MPVYDYTVLTGSGETLVQSADSPSLPALASALRSQGSTMLSAAERRARVRRVKGIPYFEVLAIYRQIAVAMQAYVQGPGRIIASCERRGYPHRFNECRYQLTAAGSVRKARMR